MNDSAGSIGFHDNILSVKSKLHQVSAYQIRKMGKFNCDESDYENQSIFR